MMKRAAGQIRKARRNKGGDKDSDYSNDPNDNNINEHAHHQPARRKPTAEEAALTAKNYRLAKELSDLRVRHREECKATSRLTMENMNLATRWRDAISQLSMLKKEVVLQQRKAAEAIAQNQKLQQQQLQMTTHDSSSSLQQRTQLQNQTPSKATPSAAVVEKSPAVPPSARAGPSLHDVAAEMDRMDRILAAHQSQSKQNQIFPPPPPPPPAKTGQDNQFTPESLVTSLSIDSKDSMNSNATSETDGEEKKSQSMDQPVTPSPDKGSRSFDSNDSDNNEENGDEEESEDFFARYKASTPVDLDDMDDDEDDVDDPPLELSPASVTPSESPPPSPPQSPSQSPEMPSPEVFDNLDSIASEGSMQGVAETSAPLFPMTASPKLIPKPKVYNDVFPADITSEVVRHPRSAERRGMAGFNENEEEDAVGTTSMRKTSNAGGGKEAARPPSLSSDFDDVFESSFATKFPGSFSPSDDKFDMDSNDEEDYNPFFPSSEESGSPNKDNKSTESSNGKNNMRFGQADDALSPVNVGRHRTASPESFQPSSLKNTEGSGNAAFPESPSNAWTSSQRSSPPNASPSHGSDNDNSIANTDSPPKEGTISTKGARYETPPHSQKSPDVILSDEPKRPEKSGAAAARARYEKALQPRGFQVGGARRFARRAERETDHGASPVNTPSTALASSSQSLKNQREENNGVQVDTSKLALAQARVKERTAVFSGRTTLSTLESKTFSSVRDNKWARPSPTDSVTSKPWDEEIGDIPMGPSSTFQNSTAASPMNGTSSGQNDDNAFGSASRSSPVGGAPRPAGYTRHRPWETGADSSKDPREFSSDTNAGMSINTTNYTSAYITRDDDTSGISTNDDDDDESPTSRYIAAGKKSRRSVKQPVSYAEPSLSAKLRRGDVFFPKVEEGDPNKNYPRASNPVHL